MALLTDEQRKDIWAEYMARISGERGLIAVLTKAELRDAVNSTDQWVSDNAASFNNALPAPAKANLTASQKSRLLTFVVAKRYQEGQ